MQRTAREGTDVPVASDNPLCPWTRWHDVPIGLHGQGRLDGADLVGSLRQPGRRPRGCRVEYRRRPLSAAAPSDLSAADLRDDIDLAVRLQRDAVGVLKNLAVDGDRHAFLDLGAQAGET